MSKQDWQHVITSEETLVDCGCKDMHAAVPKSALKHERGLKIGDKVRVTIEWLGTTNDEAAHD